MSIKTSKAKTAYKNTKAQDLLQSAEDYTELIQDLIQANGSARVSVIAKSFGISHVTVIRTIERLNRDGYVSNKPYQAIELTKKGIKLAQKTKYRHQLLLKFLLSLGVPNKVAQQDVEGMEHHVSPATLKAIYNFLAKNNSN